MIKKKNKITSKLTITKKKMSAGFREKPGTSFEPLDVYLNCVNTL